MHHLKLTISYDGTDYYGWQENRSNKTIEGTVEKVLEELLKKRPKIEVASRTDRGVHARGQVITLALGHPFPRLLHAMNALLPKTIRVTAIEDVPPDFHPSCDSKHKTYTYHISTAPFLSPFERRFVWHFTYPIDLALMHQAAAKLIGTKNFVGFSNRRTPPHKTTIRTLEAVTIDTPSPDHIDLRIEGDHFLYKMVRNLVGTIVYIGRKELPLSIIDDLLTQKRRQDGGITAPAAGLFLDHITY